MDARVKRIHRLPGYLLLSAIAGTAQAGSGKLQETAGVNQIEGSSGGGLVPWATLAGYDSREQWSASVFTTRVNFENYRLHVYGVNASINDRVELSFAQQTFELLDIPFGEHEISQQIVGVKARLYGDLVYSSWPQVSAGIHFKQLDEDVIASAAGAKDSNSGQDFYLAMAKAHLGLLAGYNVAWNATVRATKANQFGLLGYGGDLNDSYELMLEGSVAFFPRRELALGIEYRQKPNNLSFAKEEDAWDCFLAYIPNKHFNFTLSWVQMGSIAGSEDQQGLYASITGYLW